MKGLERVSDETLMKCLESAQWTMEYGHSSESAVAAIAIALLAPVIDKRITDSLERSEGSEWAE